MLGRTVLLIEDDPHAARLVQLVLERHAVRVLIGQSGHRGLQLARTESPDLVLLDLLLPGRLNGFSVLEQLRADESTAAIPVVVVSGSAEDGDQQRAQALGVEAYLTKPYRPAELIAMVLSLLEE